MNFSPRPLASVQRQIRISLSALDRCMGCAGHSCFTTITIVAVVVVLLLLLIVIAVVGPL